MTMHAEIDDYVRRLGWSLQSLGADDRAGIAREIRSHLTDCATIGEAALAEAFAGLGSPYGLARRYLEDYELAGAVGRASPLRLLLAILDRATRSMVAMTAAFSSMLLYVMAAVFVLIAIAKPIVPDQVGAWHGADGWQAGLVAQPPVRGVDMLGMWIVPLAIGLALACYLVGTRLLRNVGWRLLTLRPT